VFRAQIGRANANNNNNIIASDCPVMANKEAEGVNAGHSCDVQDQRLFKAAVMLLALANGIVGLLLQQSPGTLSKATWSGLRLVGLLPG
jgi:hypothetical protein